MAEQKQRKIFAAEKAMLNQQSDADELKASSDAVTSNSSFGLIDEITSLRTEMAEIKAILLDNATISASEIPLAEGDDDKMDRELRIELAGMIRSISQAKSELAAIKHPHAEDDRIMAASNELDAIVLATENATNAILEATERVEKELTHIAALAHEDQDILLVVDKIANEITGVLEACNFQDITGQRITKVVKTMQFLEERILAMIDIWGFESLIDVPVEKAMTDEETSDADLLNGPQMESEAISQADIDALFD